jgi:hypothetical protein
MVGHPRGAILAGGDTPHHETAHVGEGFGERWRRLNVVEKLVAVHWALLPECVTERLSGLPRTLLTPCYGRSPSRCDFSRRRHSSPRNSARRGGFRRALAVWVEGHEGGMKRGGRRTGSYSYKNVAATGMLQRASRNPRARDARSSRLREVGDG